MSVVKWPEPLVNELAARRVLVVFGSGASAASQSQKIGMKGPPTWDHFLQEANHQIKNNDPFIGDLISKRRFLDAAELIIRDMDQAEFSHFIRKVFTEPAYEPSAVHKSIHRLDAKIVMTTNYDQIYEKTLSRDAGFSIRQYTQQEILEDIRSSNPLFLKMHGCVSSPGSIVLSKSQYFKARKDCAQFYSILDALFTVHTVLFIGYSLDDPDMQLVLENVSISTPCAYKHYALVPEMEMHNSKLRSVTFEACNVRPITYPLDDEGKHSICLDALEDLVEQVLLKRDVPA